MEIKYFLITKTIPEWNRKHKKLYTCSIGYSPECGLIRVYPLPIKGMNAGFIYNIEVEKNKEDPRKASYKLITERFKDAGTFSYEKLSPFLQCNIFKSIDQLNKKKESIGLLQLNKFNLKWEYCDRFINGTQIGLFEDVQLADFTNYTKETKNKEARIIFTDADGLHNLQYNEWQVYEYQRKFNADEGAFRFLINKDFLLIGNYLQYQNNWIGLKLMSMQPQNTLF